MRTPDSEPRVPRSYVRGGGDLGGRVVTGWVTVDTSDRVRLDLPDDVPLAMYVREIAGEMTAVAISVGRPEQKEP